MKLWDVSGDGESWKVELDVGDLGGHLDFTKRKRAGTLSGRVKDAPHGVAAVGQPYFQGILFFLSIFLFF